MSEEKFEAITTQEQLNSVIAERIKRAEEKAKEPYADYEDLKSKADTYEKTIADLNAKIKGYEDSKDANGTKVQELEQKIKNYETEAVKVKVANEVGIPYELASKLAGDDEDAIRADAKTFAKYMTPTAEAPIGNPETPPANSEDAALLKVVNDLERR